MKIIKCGSVLVLSAATVGCSAEFREFELEGVSCRFCVPNAHLVMNVPWLDGVVAESSRAIGFTGCLERARGNGSFLWISPGREDRSGVFEERFSRPKMGGNCGRHKDQAGLAGR
jgi:hypothetical protein